MSLAFSLAGFAILVWRLAPNLFSRAEHKTSGTMTEHSVSIIIPARNEEKNLPRLLRSMRAIEGEKIEILIVDDGSEDQTRAVAEEAALLDARIRVLENPARPIGWNGKNWACQNAALQARGDWLLFTDADTEHLPHSLQAMLFRAEADGCDMMSALPYHNDSGFFERLMGPFHLLIFFSSSAFSKPKPGALFAIGQYLLFKRDQYFKQGAHEAVKASFGEDLDLAETCLRSGGRYGVERSGTIFRVCMYESFRAFLDGWRRIFRIGLPHASFLRVIEVFLVIACLTESFRFSRASMTETGLALAGLCLIAIAQRRYGSFSWLGAVLAPLGLAMFTYLSLMALFDRLMKRDLRWRGRSYKLTA